MKGLEKITGAILSEAEEYRTSLLDSAAKEKEKTLASYRERADALYDEQMEKAKAQCDAVSERSEESKAASARHELLRAKGEAIERAFALALEKLKNLGGEERYAFLSGLCAQAIREAIAGEEASREEIEEGEFTPAAVYELILNEKDRTECGERLVKEYAPLAAKAGKKLILAPYAEMDGGLMLRAGDIVNNCSLLPLLNEVRREKEGQIACLLFPEKKN